MSSGNSYRDLNYSPPGLGLDRFNAIYGLSPGGESSGSRATEEERSIWNGIVTSEQLWDERINTIDRAAA